MRDCKRLLGVAVTAAATLLLLQAPAVLAWPTPKAGPETSAEVAGKGKQRVERAREIVQGYMSERRIPGLTIAVSIDGKIAFSQGFGYSDLENKLPVWPHTKMRIGSVSKSLSAVALGILHEQGRLDMDAPVRRYLPSFPKKRYPVTSRQLAGHLGGIRHYRGNEFASARYYPDVKSGLEMFQNDPLIAEPGTSYNYSSYGWNLLSAVVEAASGQEFLRYMQEHVFGPAGMRHTVADRNDLIIENRTRFYLRTATGIRNAIYVDNSYKWAGGGFLSTAEDLLLFTDAFFTGRLVKPSTVQWMTTSQKTDAGEPVGYGIGWNVRDVEGRPLIGHGGGSMGGRSGLWYFPDSKLAVAWIVNVSGPVEAPRRNLTQEIADLFRPIARSGRR